MRKCILRYSGILALALLAGIIAAGCNTRADTLKPVRITLRAVSARSRCGASARSRKGRLPRRVHPCRHQCRDAAQPSERRRDRHSGLSKPGRDGRAERRQRQDRRRRAVGRPEPDHAQGRRDQIVEGARRQAHRPSTGKLCRHPVHPRRTRKRRRPLQGQSAQHHRGRTGRAAGAQERRSRWPGAMVADARSCRGRRLRLLSGVLRHRQNGEIRRRQPNPCRQYRLSQGSRDGREISESVCGIRSSSTSKIRTRPYA